MTQQMWDKIIKNTFFWNSSEHSASSYLNAKKAIVWVCN